MGELGFIDQDWLLALAGLPVLYWILMRLLKVRQARLLALGSAVTSRKAGVYLPLVFFLCAILALSRPYYGFEDVQVPRVGRDLMLVVDVSLSMSARDISPSRMDFAKRKIRDIIEFVARTSGGDRLGIVLFAGESYLFCPLTADYAVLKTFTNSISVGLIASGGSAITQALVTAANSFSTTKALKPGVIIISDGEDNELVVQRSLDVLKGLKLKLWALGVGSLEGKPIELRGNILLKDSQGQIVVTKLAEAALRQLAEGSGGMYRRATIDDSDISALFEDIGSKVEIVSAQKDETKIRMYHEYGPVLLWIPLVLMSLLLFAARRELIFGLLLAFIPAAESALAEAGDPRSEPPTTEASILSPYEAQTAFASGDFENARRSFEHYYKLNPADTKTLHALASSEYRLGKFKEASQHFAELAENSSNARERFGALYDKGTSDISAKEFSAAVEALEKSLKIKPGDEAALHNLNLARKLKEEQQQKENQQDKKQEEKKDGKSDPRKTPNPDQQKEEQPEQSDSQQQQSEEQQQTEQQDDKSGEEHKEQEDQQQGGDDAQEEGKSKEKEDPEREDQKGKPGDTQNSPSETPTARPGPAQDGETPTPGSEESKADEAEGGDHDDKEPEQPAGSPGKDAKNVSGATAHDPKALKEREAQAWLESLDDSPVLLRRQVGNKRTKNQQSW